MCSSGVCWLPAGPSAGPLATAARSRCCRRDSCGPQRTPRISDLPVRLKVHSNCSDCCRFDCCQRSMLPENSESVEREQESAVRSGSCRGLFADRECSQPTRRICFFFAKCFSHRTDGAASSIQHAVRSARSERSERSKTSCVCLLLKVAVGRSGPQSNFWTCFVKTFLASLIEGPENAPR